VNGADSSSNLYSCIIAVPSGPLLRPSCVVPLAHQRFVAVVTKALGVFGPEGKGRGSRRLDLVRWERRRDEAHERQAGACRLSRFLPLMSQAEQPCDRKPLQARVPGRPSAAFENSSTRPGRVFFQSNSVRSTTGGDAMGGFSSPLLTHVSRKR
jgi:hypothetical protein